jgi:hypothetical protein
MEIFALLHANWKIGYPKGCFYRFLLVRSIDILVTSAEWPVERCVEGRLKGHFHSNTCAAENCSFLNPWNSASLMQPCLL